MDAERTQLSDALATAFLAGPWTADDLAEAGAACLDRWPSWMTALALHIVAAYRSPPIDRRHELTTRIETFLRQRLAEDDPPQILRLLASPVRGPSPSPVRSRLSHTWPIARIDSVPDLADQLELSLGQLQWLADVRSQERVVTASKLRNYRYHALERRSGLPRVIEAPKARLKEIQRWVLHQILDHVPAHPAAHGFVRRRSIISHAARHTGQDAVLRLDLKDFFASVSAGRVYRIFATLGYRPDVAHALTGLTTNTIPQAFWAALAPSTDARLIQQQFWLGRQLATPHLPQGAPTSPALANLVAFRLDRRLTGLANGAKLSYSRYADDLIFSGARPSPRARVVFEELVTRIAREEGFVLNLDKSAILTAGRRQSVCGVVVNVRPNVTRVEYDRLKATLHNAAAHGPSSQNRAGVENLEAHLRGRIAWVTSLNPTRGDKLRRRFERIDWNA